MRTRWLLAAAALMLVLAACSSGSEADGVATLDESLTDETIAAGGDESGAATDQDQLNDFSACMRDNGVEDFEDPIVGADGSVEFGFGRGSGDAGEGFGGADRDAVGAAFEACGDLLGGVSFGPGGGGFDSTEIEDQLVAFAACMRDEGIDMDDPDLSNFAPGGGGEPGEGGPGAGGGLFGDIDLSDPDVQAAFEVCQADFAFGGGPGGRPGGGPPGSGG